MLSKDIISILLCTHSHPCIVLITEMSYKVISVKRSPASLSTLNVYLSEKVPRSLTRLAVNEMCSI